MHVHSAQPKNQPFYKILYVQVLFAIAAGVVFGHYYPTIAVDMKPLGDGFIKLVKMMIGLVIFCTVVSGITGMQDMGKIGRVGGKALLYFEVVSTGALLIGLVIGHLVLPGAGFNADPAHLDAKAVAQYSGHLAEQSVVQFILNIIPSTFPDAFVRGDILPIVFVSVLTGLIVAGAGEKCRPLRDLIDSLSEFVFKAIAILMRLAPIGAFGAMAFTIGRYGIGSLGPLAKLIATFYLTIIVFVFGILGLILRACGVNVFRFLAYIKEEILLVLGTSSSDTALPTLMKKMENLGCSKSVVGLVVPTGYVFNTDGSSIYMTMAALFVAQATNTELSFAQEAAIFGVALLTSKGASGITGGGFIALVGTLSIVPTIPLAGMALLLGIDRFMSEGRSMVNMIGNAVATLVIAKWEGEIDEVRMRRVLAADPLAAQPIVADTADADSPLLGGKLGAAE